VYGLCDLWYYTNTSLYDACFALSNNNNYNIFVGFIFYTDNFNLVDLKRNMNKYKFRAFWKDTNKQIVDFMEQYTIDVLNDDQMIIQQWTEAIDKNNVDIYEGDIVKVKRCFSRPIINNSIEIEYQFTEGEEEIGYVLWGWATYNFLVGFRLYDDFEDFKGIPHRYEVIGNIVQNPELLKGNQNL
jgi:uncharacterized phage protein (TIGR01671 family)